MDSGVVISDMFRIFPLTFMILSLLPILLKVEDILEDSKVPCFGLEYVNIGIPNITVFKQHNVTVSRKALLPLIHKFLVGGDSPLSPTNDVRPNQSFSNCNING